MKVAIVDDCRADRLLLLDFIEQYCRESRLSAEKFQFSSGERLLKVIRPGMFDVIFLDIFMEGINGFAAAEQIRKVDKKCLLVFSTTSEGYAVRSFRVRAFDYLVKPYSYNQLRETLSLCDKALKQQAHYIEVKEGRLPVRILLDDIIYTDYSNHYILFHTSRRIIKSYMSFSNLVEMLEPYTQFLSCFRNCMVNMDHVHALDKTDFIMDNGERVPIKRAIRDEVYQAYANYTFAKLDGSISM